MSIARLTTTLALSLLAAQLASGVAAACSNPGKIVKLQFKLKNGEECVEKVKKPDDSDADVIRVCETDTVQWKVSGKAKLIAFVTETPFEWAASGFEGSKIEGTVKTGTSGREFKYAVYVKDTICVLDPKIIVEP